MTLLVSALTFIFGTIIGSFISVIIYRLKHKSRKIVFSRSICPACKKKLKFRHLIPVLSFIFLRGKCGYCREKISPHYFALEILTGLLFLTTFLKWNFLTGPMQNEIDLNTFKIFIFYIIEFGFLMAIFFYDLINKEIPDSLSLPAIAVAIAGGFLFGKPLPMDMLIGGASITIFFALQFFGSKGKWLGGGDLRLGALIGVLLGWQLGLTALVIAYTLGAIISLILIIAKKATRKTAVPFGPFLVTGIISAVFFGEQILAWYLNTMTV